ncbi:6-bladed beta-propeller [Candidatus Korobacter versatilis]|nr:6-bladed beta-propeller [Candidatus Koribacter versatilis]
MSDKSKSKLATTATCILALVLGCAVPVFGGKDKKKDAAAPVQEESVLKKLDYSKIVWPNPPAITRLKYVDFFAGEKIQTQIVQEKKKSEWMARLAGGDSEGNGKNGPKQRFALATPYGMAVDSKGLLYVADGKVGAIFIFNTETHDVDMIKNGVQAHFGLITGLTIDDGDRLFVSDSQLHRVLVFGPDRKQEAVISEGLVDPGGMAVDNENRFLYVADPALDQVLVYDADKFNLIRKMGTSGKNHALTEPGQFARPTNVAVDSDSNLYVTDTSNRRVEIFDADGQFITAWGKAGDGPGTFARPKGIAIDSDGHVWVADAAQDRVQCFSKDGKVLLYLGGHGLLPGMFGNVAGLTIDKKNRVYTSDQNPGRVQMFQYISNPEARAEWERRQALEKGKTGATATASQAPANSNNKPK